MAWRSNQQQLKIGKVQWSSEMEFTVHKVITLFKPPARWTMLSPGEDSGLKNVGSNEN